MSLFPPATTTKSTLLLLPSFRRQQLLLEFATLKHHCPEGIYLAADSKDPNSWSGVFFVREGPYCSAVLRFELLFPSLYPDVPPLLTISTEIFHPLVVPLTTYSFSGSADPSATYSASETERLPPGSFNLRYRFPDWHSKHERQPGSIRTVSEGSNMSSSNNAPSNPDNKSQIVNSPSSVDSQISKFPIIRVLEYLKAAFEDPSLLDQLPLEAAGNPSAWHAWRSYRGISKLVSRSSSPTGVVPGRSGGSSRNPADWNWDGLWEARVRNGIQESISDGLLFGSKNMRSFTATNDLIRFAKYDDKKLEDIQDNMLHEF